MKKTKIETTINWIFLIVWMGIIYLFSSIPDLRISEQWWDLIVRKIAHLCEFFILALLWYKALITTKQNFSRKNLIFISCVFSIAYALLDEFHQSFVPTRNAALKDVFIDTLGILVFATLIWEK
ncbi:MAG TPA: VanZ family protein [bacterium]|nr:VanZ family protein [bacterium]